MRNCGGTGKIRSETVTLILKVVTGYSSPDGVLSIDTGGVTVDRLVIGYADGSPF